MNVVLVESGVESGGEGRVVAVTGPRDVPAGMIVDRSGELVVALGRTPGGVPS